MSLLHDPEDGSSPTVFQRFIEAVSSQDGLCLFFLANFCYFITKEVNIHQDYFGANIQFVSNNLGTYSQVFVLFCFNFK